MRVMRECTIGDRIIYEHFETISYLKVDQECDFLIYIMQINIVNVIILDIRY